MVAPIEMLLHPPKLGTFPPIENRRPASSRVPGFPKSPGGRIEGGASFGEYERTHTWSKFISIVVPQ
jgi:hypothetical protein